MNKSKLFQIVRGIAFASIRFTMIPYIAREFIQNNKVTIIVYHKINSKLAEIHFKYLKNVYNIISLSDYIQARKSKQCHLLPRKSLIITIDDGHKSNYLLKQTIDKCGIPVTIFLCGGIVGTNRHFWYENSNKMDNSMLKSIENDNRLRILKKIGYEEDKEYIEKQALADEEIEEMKSTVEFQSHTMFHPILPKCSDKKSYEEIYNSKVYLESKYNLHINAIAYPNGDYSKRELEFAREAGYECGLTLDTGYNSNSTDMYKLKRICISDDDNINELVVKTSGIWGRIKKIYSK